MLIAILTAAGLALLTGTLSRLLALPPHPDTKALINSIDALLPQTQCGQCGYPGCRPYAKAIAKGVNINKCPPGGEATIQALANLLARPMLPLDPAHGSEQLPMVAVIREEECIGCTKCIQACPVDAILGAAKQMHTVIAAECTGCDLCVEPCPVDCIDMVPVPAPLPPENASAEPCIRCGFCEPVCPSQLLPQQLWWAAQAADDTMLTAYGLDECIECGACDYVCPSQLPLVAHFHHAKEVLTERASASKKAQHARQRFENNQARRAQPERTRGTPNPRMARATAPAATTSERSAQAHIQAALARAKGKGQAVPVGAKSLAELQQRADQANLRYQAALTRLREAEANNPGGIAALTQATEKLKQQAAAATQTLKRAQQQTASSDETEFP